MSLLAAISRAPSRKTPASFGAPRFSWTIAFALVLSAALIGIEGWQMLHMRDASLRNARIVTANLAESLSQQIETTLRTGDTVVASLVQRVESDGVTPDSKQRLYGIMTSLASALPAIHEMGLIDEAGNAVVKSLVPHPVGLNYADRDYFRYFKSHDTRDVFIGRPVQSKVDGTRSVTISRRVNRNGRFAGIVVTSVSMDFFRRLFDTVQLKSGRHIGLIADSGMVLTASPASFGEGELEALRAAPKDARDYRSPVNGIDRVGAYKQLAHYPMTVMVTEDSSAVLADWYSQLRVHGTIVAFILAIIAVLGRRVDQANQAARVQALRDALTGLANRRWFNETIEREFRRATRSGRPLSLIMMDIDFFKTYNDRHGHPAGDACLRTVSAAIKTALMRPGDMAARYGGEEIAVLLPDTDIAGAVRIVDNIRAAVQALAIRHDDSPHGVITLSAGLATWSPGRIATTPSWLIDAADGALYAAKAQGRNTYAVHSAGEIPSVATRHAA